MLVFVQKGLDTVATIRRLSTASYVTDPENTMATQWTWYWKDEYETWRKYDQDQGVSCCIWCINREKATSIPLVGRFFFLSNN